MEDTPMHAEADLTDDDTGCHADDDVINTLPEEILERILAFLSPYGECKQASMVCKRWNRVIQGVLQQTRQAFHSAAADGRLQWSYHECPATPLTARHSHNMCRVGEHIYVFGGCSSSLTSFNDMWKLDLQRRTWTRVLALGSCPSPKAAASMVTYKGNLIVFGGWAPPVPYPLHQAPRIFNELQWFSIKQKRWHLALTQDNPPSVAGHKATIVGDRMIVFGGLINEHNRLNDVYEVNLIMMSWRLVHVGTPKPEPRYGHLQYLLGDKHLLIIGGCGISNKTLSDVWLLQMDEPNAQWKWIQIEVQNQEHLPPVIVGHGACLIGSTITIFGKSKNPSKPVAMRRSQVLASAPRAVPSIPRPVPSSRHPVERPAVNIRQELRSHGVLLNGTNKRAHAESKSGTRQQNALSEDQPSTSGGQRSGQNLSDFQVCDELHTNTVGTTNMLHMEAVDDHDEADDIATRCASNICFNKAMAQRSGQRSKVKGQSAVGVKINSQEKQPLIKSNLNQAHTGQFGPRKGVLPKKPARNAANDANCSCRSQSIHPTPLSKHFMQQYVLDISKAITHGFVTWQPIRDPDSDNVVVNQPIPLGVSSQHGPPTERCFSSVCEGRGELIMFGGLLDDTSKLGFNGKRAVNTVYYAS